MRWLRRAAIAFAAIALVIAAVIGIHAVPAINAAKLPELLRTARIGGMPTWLALISFQVLVTVSGIFPASLVGVAAGALYGLAAGFGLAATGTFAGALLAFWVSRSLFRPLVVRLVQRRQSLRQFEAALGRSGWKLVCLLRASPVMPFVAASYMLGVSSISLRDYAIGTLAAFPALFAYVALGALGKAGLDASGAGAGLLRWSLLALGALSAALLIVYLRQLSGRAIRPTDLPLTVTDR
ncbi:MAG TPA: VTT domain-containing protein [Acetobacteraceae bacterium]